MMPAVCPDCRVELKPRATSCVCGWKKPGTAVAARPGADPDWWRCADELVGMRCGNAGGISLSTHGGGPWYCQDHYMRHVRPAIRHAPAPNFFEQARQTIGSGHVPQVIDAEYSEVGEARSTQPIDAETAAERAAIVGERGNA